MSDHWEEVADEEGRIYYFNNITQETSWDKPLKRRWKTYLTDDGKQYYYNEETGETAWEVPDEDKESIVVDDRESNPLMEDDTGTSAPINFKTHIKTSEVDEKLAEQGVVRNDIIDPPKFKSFKEAEEVFMDFLKSNSVDSTWSFQAVMSKFIKSPIYWAIPDSLHRKKLYDDYLVQRLKEEMSNKSAIAENFEKNFNQVLQDYEKRGYIKYHTRWFTIKRLLIEEENPIFKNSFLSDKDISKLYNKYISELRDKIDNNQHKDREQALDELELYLTQTNPKIVSESRDWEALYDNLQKDSRFKANKHFTVLKKQDILELYINKIHRNTVDILRSKVRKMEEKNYRADRKAREAFKNYLERCVPINGNTLFRDVFPMLENENSFIELCGRNGSSPLDLFWDIVDAKYQDLRLKKNIIETILSEMKALKGQEFNDEIMSSKESFVKTFIHINDDRLSAFDYRSKNVNENSNELELVYDSIKRDLETQKELLQLNVQKEIRHRIRKLAQSFLRNNKYKQFMTIVNGPETSDDSTNKIRILADSGNSSSIYYTLQEFDREYLLGTFRNAVESEDTAFDLESLVKKSSSRSLEDFLKAIVEELIYLLNTKQSEEKHDSSNVKRTMDDDPRTNIKRRKADDNGEDSDRKGEASKKMPVLLNY